jgi:FkbM family methyltransferase
VLDIGANIGTFAVLAARHRCRRLVAVEPSLEAYHVLCQNLRENGLEHRCTAIQAAVCGREQGLVEFPVASSALNSLQIAAPSEALVGEVSTTTLGRLLEEYFPDGLDLLKMDCEGAEVEIVAESSEQDWHRVRAVRMEFHGPDPGATRQRLESVGFQVDLYERLGPVTHTLWLSRQVRR